MTTPTEDQRLDQLAKLYAANLSPAARTPPRMTRGDTTMTTLHESITDIIERLELRAKVCDDLIRDPLPGSDARAKHRTGGRADAYREAAAELRHAVESTPTVTVLAPPAMTEPAPATNGIEAMCVGLVTEQRYPLWCADSGETDSELRYRGAFDSAADLEPLEAGETLRRCRRVQASELQRSLESAIAFMVEDIEDRASSGDLPDDAFADFDTAVVECADLTALRKAVESHLVVHAFVCEGDE